MDTRIKHLKLTLCGCLLACVVKPFYLKNKNKNKQKVGKENALKFMYMDVKLWWIFPFEKDTIHLPNSHITLPSLGAIVASAVYFQNSEITLFDKIKKHSAE